MCSSRAALLKPPSSAITTKAWTPSKSIFMRGDWSTVREPRRALEPSAPWPDQARDRASVREQAARPPGTLGQHARQALLDPVGQFAHARRGLFAERRQAVLDV